MKLFRLQYLEFRLSLSVAPTVPKGPGGRRQERIVGGGPSLRDQCKTGRVVGRIHEGQRGSDAGRIETRRETGSRADGALRLITCMTKGRSRGSLKGIRGKWIRASRADC
jgi:hypothetical protein